jgi:hypothetical protein
LRQQLKNPKRVIGLGFFFLSPALSLADDPEKWVPSSEKIVLRGRQIVWLSDTSRLGCKQQFRALLVRTRAAIR